jgi:sugar O-acyltransferase (sialic acid O-acetyltransferase NeuD family)
VPEHPGEAVVVVGAGGHAKVVIATLRECGLGVEAVVDDDPSSVGGSVAGVPVVGTPSAYFERRRPPALIAVGDNRQRRDLALRLAGARWATVVHPRACVHPSVQLGAGTVVFAGAVVQPDAQLGCHVIVNTAATVDHDVAVGDYVHLAPGAHVAGAARLDEGTMLGIGGVVAPGVTVGPWTTVGAGACVISNLDGHLTAVGVPARPLVSVVS